MKIIDLPVVQAGKPIYIPHPTKWHVKTKRQNFRICVKAGTKTTQKVYTLKTLFTKAEHAHKVAVLIAAKGTILCKNWTVLKTL